MNCSPVEERANVGVAPDVARDLPGFVTEPDRRNLEYVTDPIRDYAELPEALLAPTTHTAAAGCRSGS